MKPVARALVVAALAVGLAGLSPASSATAATEVVTGGSLLPAPTELTPDDSVTPFPHAVLKNVRLNWKAVAGAAGYRIEIGRDSTWSDSPVLTGNSLFSEWTVPVALPVGTYVWRVAAKGPGGTLGHWSSESNQQHPDAEFTHGWRGTPTPAAVAPYTNLPTFTWTPVADASGYQVQVSTQPFHSGIATGPSPDTTPGTGTQSQAESLVADCFTPHTRLTPGQDEVGKSDTVGECKWLFPDAGSTLYWRVRALDAWASTAEAPQTQPQTAFGPSYLPRSDDDSVFIKCSATPDFDCEADRASLAGPWSTVQSFPDTPVAPVSSVLTTVPTASLGADPDNLCTVTNPGALQAEHARCVDVPTISWQAATGATYYRLTFALDDSFANVQHVIDVPALQFTVPGSWADGSATTSYYYGVQACTGSSCGELTRTPPSFSKVTPRLTLGSNPPVAGEFSLTWQSYAAALRGVTDQAETQDAYAYHLQVARSDHPNFDQLVDDQLVDETYFTPLKSYGDGEFVWRVQPVDSAGNRLPFSLSKKFTRDATPPKAVSVSPSGGVPVTQPLTVTFSEPVTGVTATSLALSPAVTHTVFKLSATQWRITPTVPMVPGATYRVVLTSAIKDLSGNAANPLGPTFTVSGSIADNSKAFSYAGSWSTRSASNAIGGSYHAALPTSSSHPYATTKFAGVGVSLISCLGPSNGYLDVYVDNVKKARISLYRSFSGCGVKVAGITGLARATHTLKLVGVGAHQSASKGNGVAVDHVTVL